MRIIRTDNIYFLSLVEGIVTADQKDLDNGKVIEKTYYYEDEQSAKCDEDYLAVEDVGCPLN